MPCMSIACGTADSVYAVHSGLMDEKTGSALTADALFDLASLTKLLTGLLVMRLNAEGRLDLSAHVTRYAPQFVHLQAVPVDAVLGFEVALTTDGRVDAQPSAEAARRVLLDIRPGEVTGRAYSDMHAMVLRHVIEGAAGEDYAALIERVLLKPLGMKDTFLSVPENRRGDCVSCNGEHRIERGRFILRQDVSPGTPHDPKARALWPDVCGHAGAFATRSDLVRLCQGLLKGDVIPREALIRMSRNRTGYRRSDGSYQQYLGAQCYVRHPVQYYSEIPPYESDLAIGLSGFTGHHLSVDVGKGVFVLALGSRCQNRLTVVLPEPRKTLADYGLNPDGTGCITWPDGHRVWSSVDYVHHKDAHLHPAVAHTLGLAAL